MAGGRIKGITIELNGDSTKLEASLKSVNSEIKNTESKLKDVNKLLKMDPGNTNLLSQKYKTLQQEIQATKQKLDTLKEASKQADQALKDGTISKEQYDALQSIHSRSGDCDFLHPDHPGSIQFLCGILQRAVGRGQDLFLRHLGRHERDRIHGMGDH